MRARTGRFAFCLALTTLAVSAAAPAADDAPPPGQSGFVLPQQQQPPPPQQQQQPPPPQPVQMQPMQPQPAPQPVPAPAPPPQGQRFAQNRRGLMTNVRGGLGLAAAGSLSDVNTAGAMVSVAAGWEAPGGLQGFVELGGRYHQGAVEPLRGVVARQIAYADIVLGLGGRFVPMRESLVHPFFEGAVDLHILSITPPGREFENRVPITLGLAAGAGLELDVAESLSIELGVRGDFILSAQIWQDSGQTARASNPDLLVTPFLGGTYYY